ncbi:hypothetical protein D3C80_1227400 [compost metagenome]
MWKPTASEKNVCRVSTKFTAASARGLMITIRHAATRVDADRNCLPPRSLVKRLNNG